jgi:hypothetical protein
MSAKPMTRKRAPAPELEDEAVSDTHIERFLAEHQDEVAAKLDEARKSIARGDAAALEPLPTLLREARRAAKTAR